MICAQFQTNSGPGLLIGLSRTNVERLTQGQPIHMGPDHPAFKVAGMEVLLIFGETERVIMDHLQKAGFISEETKTQIDPRL